MPPTQHLHEETPVSLGRKTTANIREFGRPRFTGGKLRLNKKRQHAACSFLQLGSVY